MINTKSRLVGPLLLIIFCAVNIFASDKEFNNIVKQIETNYHIKQKHIPFLGLASFMAKTVVRPSGFKGLKLAIFEHNNLSLQPGKEPIDLFLQHSLAKDWQQIVKVYSHKDKEWTYIYIKEMAQKECKVLIVNLDKEESVVLEAHVEPEKLLDWLDKKERKTMLKYLDTDDRD